MMAQLVGNTGDNKGQLKPLAEAERGGMPGGRGGLNRRHSLRCLPRVVEIGFTP